MPGSRLNDTERRLKERWNRAWPHNTLRGISIEGDPGLRGIRKLSVEFKYPLTVICGRNGSGKTTLLSLAALSYHTVNGHFPRGALLSQQANRTSAYYTFKDFFYKGPGDPDISGVNICWNFSQHPALAITKRSEKWMHYERRPAHVTQYLGVSRAIPAIEQSVLRSHFPSRRSHSNRVQLTPEFLRRLSAIMGRPYTDADELHSRNYSLRTCRSSAAYSSFNMGAGEDVLIDLLGVLQAAPVGSLIVIEEIELGMHPLALSALAQHLLEIVAQKHLQIIVSSHSREFVDAVPREARILIQPSNDEHSILYSPTTRFAMGELSGRFEPELCIYCEDDVAEHIIGRSLDGTLRRRVKVQPVGDKTTLATQALSHLRGNFGMRHLVIWDGDVTDAEVNGWIANNPQHSPNVSFCFLPSDLPPERWITDTLNCQDGYQAVAREFDLPSTADAMQFVQRLASLAEHHEVPFIAGQELNKAKSTAFEQLVKCAKSVDSTHFNNVNALITQALDGVTLRGRS